MYGLYYNDYSSANFVADSVGSPTDNHPTGSVTYVRAGGSHDSNSFQPGLFTVTLEPEYSESSYGVGTAYCGRVFYANRGLNVSHISTGIGTYRTSNNYTAVSSDCLAHSISTREYAYCDYDGVEDTCPLGWGSYDTLAAGQPGCWSGTYYPSPIQAGNHTPNTGSRYPDCFINLDYHLQEGTVDYYTGDSFQDWPIRRSSGFFTSFTDDQSSWFDHGSLELTISFGIIMVTNFPMYSLEGPILTSIHGVGSG